MIPPDQRRALAAIRINSAATQDDVWSRSPFHVEGLHRTAEKLVLEGIEDARTGPLGVVIQGQKGVGKTHLLGWVREQVQARGGYFFRISLKQGLNFWAATAREIRDDLNRPDDESQLSAFLRRLCVKIGRPDAGDVDQLAAGLVRFNRPVGLRCADTLRALALYASDDWEAAEVGKDYLASDEEFVATDWARWGIRRKAESPQTLVEEVSALLALTGPTVIAVDQIDQLIVGSQRKLGSSETDDLCAEIGSGLMELREGARNTLVIVTCLPNSWDRISGKAADTVADRFRKVETLSRIVDGGLARALVEKRLGPVYAKNEFIPPHTTWPVAPRAFAGQPDCTPRQLFQRVEAHARACLALDRISELDRLDQEIEDVIEPPRAEPAYADFAEFDTRFARLRRDAEVGPALDPASEDKYMPGLLSAGLAAWIIERGNDRNWQQGPAPSVRPALHAQLIRTLDEETDDEAYWAFRAANHPHHIAALKRLRDARKAADLTDGNTRKLVMLRDVPWNTGPVTQRELGEFRELGGRDLPIGNEDLRTFGALRELLDMNEVGLAEWLVSRRPASSTELFGQVLPLDDPGWPTENPDERIAAEPAAPSSIVVGAAMRDGTPVEVALESLRKHVTIFAGSGSGKTVFIRRLVEECALHGVSAIVLDPNNDLARLGDRWPRPPSGWGPGDQARADRYLADTEVVVWTPGRTGGRPLTFRALPDFAEVLDSEDDFRSAVGIAVDTLAPKAKVNGPAVKAERGRAVLRETIGYYGRQGLRSVTGLIALLADLPDGVSTIGNAHKLAADMAENLRAAQVNDPLFSDGGRSIDPGELLTASPGRRARVSVISFIGLTSTEQRQGFVSQLQMELFAWVKKHPAGDRPLGGLLVMDEAQVIAPATGQTPSTQSTILLASQARKFGLGLVLATQAPKGLHNQVSGNATTQLIGKLTHPTQLNAAREIVLARGNDPIDFGKLRAGEFSMAGEDFGFRQVRTPQCLSHHPKSALTPEEVEQRARRPL